MRQQRVTGPNDVAPPQLHWIHVERERQLVIADSTANVGWVMP